MPRSIAPDPTNARATRTSSAMIARVCRARGARQSASSRSRSAVTASRGPSARRRTCRSRACRRTCPARPYPLPRRCGESAARLVAHQEMDAAVDEVLPAAPAHGNPAGLGRMLEDLRAVAVALRMDARGEAGQARADDDEGSIWHDDLLLVHLRWDQYLQCCPRLPVSLYVDTRPPPGAKNAVGRPQPRQCNQS